MFLLGLRTGEACGLQFGDISLYDDFSVTRIGRQNKSTGITNRLKTNASYRYVVGSYFFTALLLKRIKFLCSKGYDIETISTLPIVSQNANYGEFVDSSVLSEYARRILIACGITESAISASRFLLNDDPDTQNPDFTEKDITAYILRRDFASRCGNICGLSTSDIDYLLGHISQNKTIKDYSNFDTQKMLAGMLERAILHPNYTRNPLYLFSQFLPKRKAILPGSQIIFLLPLLI
jgi:integrase